MAMDNVKPRGNRKRRKVCAFCVDKVEHPAAPPAPAPCISVS